MRILSNAKREGRGFTAPSPSEVKEEKKVEEPLVEEKAEDPDNGEGEG